MLIEMDLLCCLIITFRAGVLDSFMDRLDMSVEMALSSCLIVTFRAQKQDSFMDRPHITVETALCCGLILTFRAGVLDSFMDRLDMLVEMAPSYCLIRKALTLLLFLNFSVNTTNISYYFKLNNFIDYFDSLCCLQE